MKREIDPKLGLQYQEAKLDAANDLLRRTENQMELCIRRLRELDPKHSAALIDSIEELVDESISTRLSIDGAKRPAIVSGRFPHRRTYLPA